MNMAKEDLMKKVDEVIFEKDFLKMLAEDDAKKCMTCIYRYACKADWKPKSLHCDMIYRTSL